MNRFPNALLLLLLTAGLAGAPALCAAAADAEDVFNPAPDNAARIEVLEDPGSGGPTPGSSNQVPIDGGLGWLAAAGAGYAMRKLRQRRQPPTAQPADSGAPQGG